MRVLETTFLILNLVLLIWFFKRDAVKSFAFTILSACTFLIFLLHLIIEGWRWQMVPAYLAGAVILIVFTVKKFVKSDVEDQTRKWFRTALKVLFSGAAILLVLISGVLSWALPVFKLPAPTGPYKVGTSKWFLDDKSREERLTIDPNDSREILVQSWYPANVSGLTRTAAYVSNPKLIGKAMIASPDTMSMLGLTRFRETLAGFLFDYFRLVRTHSYPNAVVLPKQAPYPVLIFSHGYGAVAEQNTVLMEELASHGYAVFSIGHTYESLVVEFPDGQQAFFSPPKNIFTGPSELRKAEEIKAGDLAASIALWKNFTTPQAFLSLHVWSADTRFVIDWLEKMNAEDSASPYYHRLDMQKLGVFGMSFGGSTACQVLFEDSRVKAAINMDGGLPSGDLIDRSFDIPFMFMNSESTSETEFNQILRNYMLGRSNAAIYNITVMGSKHHNFTDISVWSPVLKFAPSKVGKINGDKMLKIINVYILAFFDRYLKGIDSPLLNGPSPDFPEVIFKAEGN